MPGGNASLESSAKTVEEAIEHGLAVMGLSPEEVEIEVLNKGSRGVFGLGAEDAVVRLTAKAPRRAPAARPAPVEEMPEVEVEPEVEAELEIEAEPEPQRPTAAELEDGAVGPLAAAMLEKLLTLMSIQARVEAGPGTDLVEEGEAPSLVLNIRGEDLGILIGRRGETLGALQYMLRLMLSRELGRWEPVVVDVESYRVRRRRSLRQLAQRMADRVAFSRRKVVLEAMPAYERRIIHLALRDHPSVVTQSIGEGQNRKVTILPK